MEDSAQEIQKANEAFYGAFEHLDIHRMDDIWWHDDDVKCIHPGWAPRLGWPQVRDSWVVIFNHTYRMTFSVCVIEITVKGDFGWIVCREQIGTSDHDRPMEGTVMATNLFERRGGLWRMIHHHGSPYFAPDTALPMAPSAFA